jgi:hypothetical protein
MRWQDKMDILVKDILGIEYTCIVNSDKSFTIFENGDPVAKRSSINYLEAHWRNELAETLKIMYNEKIQKSLLKY